MKKVVVNVKVDRKVKKQVQEVAEELGFSLSALVNAYLKFLGRTRAVFFVAETLKESLKRTLRTSKEDIQQGKISPEFSTADDAVAWLNGTRGRG